MGSGIIFHNHAPCQRAAAQVIARDYLIVFAHSQVFAYGSALNVGTDWQAKKRRAYSSPEKRCSAACYKQSRPEAF